MRNIPVIMIIVMGMITTLPVAALNSVENSVVQSDFYHSLMNTTPEALGLSQAEYERYVEIMSGPMRFWKPIDPLFALGMFEESEEARKSYAKRFAQKEYELTARVLAFQREYSDAFKALYPQRSYIDDELLNAYINRKTIQNKSSRSLFHAGKLNEGDRVVYFPDVGCTTACQFEANQLIRWVVQNETTNLDIYVLNAGTEKDVRLWATNTKIPRELVQNGKLSLNINQHEYRLLNERENSGRESRFFLNRNGAYYRINPTEVMF